LYPQLEDGDAELRATPLEWVGSSLVLPLQMAPVNKARHGWLDYSESRKIGYEEQADTEEKKAARTKALGQGKIAPEDFDKSFEETPKVFYVSTEAVLDECNATLQALDSLCREKFATACICSFRKRGRPSRMRLRFKPRGVRARRARVLRERPPEGERLGEAPQGQQEF
jgi:hypothetical protein